MTLGSSCGMGRPDNSDITVPTSVCFSVIFSMMMSASVCLQKQKPKKTFVTRSQLSPDKFVYDCLFHRIIYLSHTHTHTISLFQTHTHTTNHKHPVINTYADDKYKYNLYKVMQAVFGQPDRGILAHEHLNGFFILCVHLHHTATCQLVLTSSRCSKSWPFLIRVSILGAGACRKRTECLLQKSGYEAQVYGQFHHIQDTQRIEWPILEWPIQSSVMAWTSAKTTYKNKTNIAMNCNDINIVQVTSRC